MSVSLSWLRYWVYCAWCEASENYSWCFNCFRLLLFFSGCCWSTYHGVDQCNRSRREISASNLIIVQCACGSWKYGFDVRQLDCVQVDTDLFMTHWLMVDDAALNLFAFLLLWLIVSNHFFVFCVLSFDKLIVWYEIKMDLSVCGIIYILTYAKDEAIVWYRIRFRTRGSFP